MGNSGCGRPVVVETRGCRGVERWESVKVKARLRRCFLGITAVAVVVVVSSPFLTLVFPVPAPVWFFEVDILLALLLE